MTRHAVVLAVAISGIVAGRAARAQVSSPRCVGSDRVAVEQLARDAQEDIRVGMADENHPDSIRLEHALTLIESACRSGESATPLLRLRARALVVLGRFAEAAANLRAFRLWIDAQPNMAPDVRALAQQSVLEIESRLREHLVELTVRATPPGAAVRVGDADVGLVPVEGVFVEPNAVVTLNAPGYSPSTQRITATVGSATTLIVHLDRAPGESPIPAQPTPVAAPSPLTPLPMERQPSAVATATEPPGARATASGSLAPSAGASSGPPNLTPAWLVTGIAGLGGLGAGIGGVIWRQNVVTAIEGCQRDHGSACQNPEFDTSILLEEIGFVAGGVLLAVAVVVGIVDASRPGRRSTTSHALGFSCEVLALTAAACSLRW